MAKTKEAAKVAPEVKEAAKVAKSSVVVTWNGGSREYSKAVHGDAFVELAEEFAGKKNGTVA